MNDRTRDTLTPSPWRRKIVFFSVLLVIAGVIGAMRWWKEIRTVYRVPILMYHKIGDGHDSAWWVTVSDFENQLQDLKEQGYRSILPADLVAHQRWGKRLPEKSVIITFDDGYLNCMEQAEPLLWQYGFQAVCYLITGQVSETPDTRKTYEGAPILSWEEVRAMQQRGTVTFGGHSRSHANLRAVQDAYPEARACYEDIQKIGGFEPAGFCYPFGEYHEKTPPAVAKAGFTTAVTCEDGVAETGPNLKLMELPRVSVMGGPHRYHVESVSTNPAGTLAVRIWKEGHSMKTHPRLVWLGQAQGPEDGWLPGVSIADQPVTLTWTLPVPAAGTPVVELWDDFRVLKLFRAIVALPNVATP